MHKCVRCGSVYEDNDSNILRGCASCGSIFFLYMKGPEDVTQLDAVEKNLQSKDTTLEKELVKQIERRKADIEVAKEAERIEKAEEEIEFVKEAKRKKAKEIKKGKAAKGKRVSKRFEAEPKGWKRLKKLKGPKKLTPKTMKEARKETEGELRKEVVKIGGKKFAVEELFGVETIRVPREGVYEINIDALMKNQPVIVLEKGQIYIIHLPEVFEAVEKK
jgi:predicted  nucleic acid-binding Zn-ribbon protein